MDARGPSTSNYITRDIPWCREYIPCKSSLTSQVTLASNMGVIATAHCKRSIIAMEFLFKTNTFLLTENILTASVGEQPDSVYIQGLLGLLMGLLIRHETQKIS